MANFEKSQKIVGLNEGGYQSDPRDEGNYHMGNLIGTNWGISATTLAGFLGRVPSVSDMKNLTRSTAEQILKANYWHRNNFDKLKNQSVATLIYDGTVNQGTNAMRFLLEKVLAKFRKTVSYYEVFSVKGIEVLNGLDQRRLFDSIKQARANKYRSSTQKQYINGWLKRLDRIQYVPGSSSHLLIYMSVLLVGVGLIFIGV
jgi:lysozyme family protein